MPANRFRALILTALAGGCRSLDTGFEPDPYAASWTITSESLEMTVGQTDTLTVRVLGPDSSLIRIADHWAKFATCDSAARCRVEVTPLQPRSANPQSWQIRALVPGDDALRFYLQNIVPLPRQPCLDLGPCGPDRRSDDLLPFKYVHITVHLSPGP